VKIKIKHVGTRETVDEEASLLAAFSTQLLRPAVSNEKRLSHKKNRATGQHITKPIVHQQRKKKDPKAGKSAIERFH
jgi:hypothetical protein